jgi:predicted DNA-binding transcriptional regulator YafY
VNRIDRLFAIITLLQSRGRLRAREIAAHFEVSQRTIYRDVTALSESGIPVVALPGQGYELAEGFFLPPLQFSTPEASALVLGARLLASSASPNLANAAKSAEAKIVTLLGETSRRYLHEIGEAVDVSMVTAPSARFNLDDEGVFQLWRAILERRIVTLRYFGRNRAEHTVRQIEPLRLGYINGVWYLAAYCRLREAERNFRLERIESFTVETTRFRPRPAAEKQPRPTIEVVVRFTAPATRWVQERQHWTFVNATDADGCLTATYRPDHLDEIATWILGWGTAAEVISPPQLRERLLAEACGVVQRLT